VNLEPSRHIKPVRALGAAPEPVPAAAQSYPGLSGNVLHRNMYSHTVRPWRRLHNRQASDGGKLKNSSKWGFTAECGGIKMALMKRNLSSAEGGRSDIPPEWMISDLYNQLSAAKLLHNENNQL